MAQENQNTQPRPTTQEKVCQEIIQIMETYDEQIERNGYVDTPGGLEHMGDVWRKLDKWRAMLTAKKGI